MQKVSSLDIHKFQQTIWDYYKKEGRDMSWRKTRNAYRILVSEIMLQQTQVSRVLLKYELFLKKFPNFNSLDKASAADILSAWQGLGYNRRALALKKIAHFVVQENGGVFPQDEASLQKLPSIGKATAGSLVAFIYNAPSVFIETNIRRVYIHHFYPKTKRVSDDDILKLVKQTVSQKNPREWYYALMDYGAMLRKEVKNPNHRSAHYAKQSKFIGSKRQLRGGIIKLLTQNKNMQDSEIIKRIPSPTFNLKDILKDLEKEGFIERKKGLISLKK